MGLGDRKNEGNHDPLLRWVRFAKPFGNDHGLRTFLPIALLSILIL